MDFSTNTDVCVFFRFCPAEYLRFIPESRLETPEIQNLTLSSPFVHSDRTFSITLRSETLLENTAKPPTDPFEIIN
jgi:hypothetical protein